MLRSRNRCATLLNSLANQKRYGSITFARSVLLLGIMPTLLFTVISLQKLQSDGEGNQIHVIVITLVQGPTTSIIHIELTCR
jgi:hypothetical protein